MQPYLASLQAAFAELAARTQRRVTRLHQLCASPDIVQNRAAIAAEKREIALAQQTAGQVERVFTTLLADLSNTHNHLNALQGRLVSVVEEAAHYERLFHTTLDQFGLHIPEMSDEQWPPAAATAMRAIYRMQHMHLSPETYATTFPTPFPNPPSPNVSIA